MLPRPSLAGATAPEALPGQGRAQDPFFPLQPLTPLQGAHKAQRVCRAPATYPQGRRQSASTSPSSQSHEAQSHYGHVCALHSRTATQASVRSLTFLLSLHDGRPAPGTKPRWCPEPISPARRSAVNPHRGLHHMSLHSALPMHTWLPPVPHGPRPTSPPQRGPPRGAAAQGT